MEPRGRHHGHRCDPREHLIHTNTGLDAESFLVRFSGKEAGNVVLSQTEVKVLGEAAKGESTETWAMF